MLGAQYHVWHTQVRRSKARPAAYIGRQRPEPLVQGWELQGKGGHGRQLKLFLVVLLSLNVLTLATNGFFSVPSTVSGP